MKRDSFLFKFTVLRVNVIWDVPGAPSQEALKVFEKVRRASGSEGFGRSKIKTLIQ